MAKPKHLILLHSISHPKMAPDSGAVERRLPEKWVIDWLTLPVTLAS